MKGRGTQRYRRGRRGTRKRKRNQTRKRRGGGLSLANILVGLPFGQEIVNVGRLFTTGAKNMVRGYRGIKPAPSPMPTKGQFRSDLKFKNIRPPNVRKIRNTAKSNVASLEKSL